MIDNENTLTATLEIETPHGPSDPAAMVQALVARSADAMLLHGADLSVRWANAAAVEQGIGRDSQTPCDWTGVFGTACYRQRVEQVLLQGQPVEGRILNWRDAQGRPRWCEIRLLPEVAPDGTLTGCWSVVHDVTALHDTMQRLQATLKEQAAEREHMAEVFRRRNQALQALSDNTPDTIARYAPDLRRVYANPALVRLTGRPVDELLGQRPTDHQATPEAIEYEHLLAQALQTGQELDYVLRWHTGAGQAMSSHVRIVPETDAQGRVTSVLAIGRDITPLEASERRLEAAQRVARIYTWEIDYVLRRPVISLPGRQALGFDAHAELTLDQFIGVIPAEERPAIDAMFAQAIAQRAPAIEYEHGWTSPDGEHSELHSWVRIEYGIEGQPLRALGVTQNVTSIKQLQRQTHQLAFYDGLTQLPNRALLRQRMSQAVDEAGQSSGRVGLLMLDIDHFQKVNDSLGYGSGDTLLKTVSQRLTEALRDGDTVARLGGDEFAVLVPHLRQADDLHAVAQRVKGAFERPVEIDGTPLVLTASAGIAVYPEDGADVDELLAHADAAMSHAKDRGRDNVQFYARALTETALDHLRLEADLRQALPRGELELFYQPKMNLHSGKLVGAEALMRWRHPQRGLVPPDRFIPVAEEAGLIVEMGAWALRQACVQARAWNREGAEPIKIAVNLSPRQFYSGDLVQTVQQALDEAGCHPQWIELEITESLLLNDRDDIRDVLEALHALGLTIAIDDFGTGYSALSYLTRFPVDTIKIDRSFIRELTTDRQSEVLAKAIVTLGNGLRLQVVAEGVETEAQRDYLSAWNCQMAQGYLYSKPVPASEFPPLIARWG